MNTTILKDADEDTKVQVEELVMRIRYDLILLALKEQS